MMPPTKAIKTNARNLLVLMTVCSIVILVFELFWRTVELNQIHEAIGVYGLKVGSAFGMDINGILGSWWSGHEILEVTISRDFGIGFGFGLGVTIAILPLALMYNYVKTAIHRIETLEKQIGD